MASIEKRPRSDGSTAYRVSWRDPDTGKDGLTFDDPQDAERLKKLLDANGQKLTAANQVMAAIKNKIPTVDDIVEHHISHLTGVEERTKRDYRSIARHHISPHLGGLPADRLDTDRARQWVNDVWAGKRTDWERLPPLKDVLAALDEASAADVAKTLKVSVTTVRRILGGAERPMASKTLHNIHALLSGSMKTAMRMRLPSGALLRTDNPCEGIRLPRLFQEEMTFLTQPEYHLIYGHIRAWYQPLVDFLASTGARWGEAIALTVGDVDVLAKPATVRISKAVKRAENGYYIGSPKTLKSVRTISIPAGMVDTLIPLVSARASDAPLFSGPRGGIVHYGKFRSDVWVPALEKAQAAVDEEGNTIPRELRLLKRPGLHALRHSHASWLIADRVDLPTVQHRLGHEKISTTSDIYGHLMPDQLEKAALAADLMFANRPAASQT